MREVAEEIARDWYAGGLEHMAEELETRLRLSRLRAAYLSGAYREPLAVFDEAMEAAIKELRKASEQLRRRRSLGRPMTNAERMAFDAGFERGLSSGTQLNQEEPK